MDDLQDRRQSRAQSSHGTSTALPQDTDEHSPSERTVRADNQAFISHSHSARDKLLAQAIKKEIESFSRRWYAPKRAFKVYLDTTSLSPGSDLPGRIKEALDRSHWLILIASPESAASDWVKWELKEWLEEDAVSTKQPSNQPWASEPTSRILIALSRGAIEWDPDAPSGGDFDWDKTTALPSDRLRKRFLAEPLYIDFSSIASDESDEDVKATLQEAARAAAPDFLSEALRVPKEELVGERRRYQRNVRRTAFGTVALLSILLVASLIAGVVAVKNAAEATTQRNSAVNQARIATSRQLAALSQAAAPADLQRSVLYAVAGYRMDDNQATEQSLSQVSDNSQHLVRFVDAGAQVSATATSADGSTVLAGTDGGSIYRWDTNTGRRSDVGQLGSRIVSLDSDSTAGTIGAVTGTIDAGGYVTGQHLTIWVDGDQRSNLLDSIPGFIPRAVTVSPSGHTLAVSGTKGTTGQVAIIHLPGASMTMLSEGITGDVLVLSDDNSMTIVNGGGMWWRIDLSTGAAGTGNEHFGNYNYGYALSGDGRRLAETNGTGQVPVTVLDSSSTDGGLETPGGFPHPIGFALSPAGDNLAQSVDGSIVIWPVQARAQREEPNAGADPTHDGIVITGTGPANPGTLRFAGKDRLISGTGSSLGIWNVSADPQGTVDAVTTPQPENCAGCGRMNIAAAPDGQNVFIYNAMGTDAVVVNLHSREYRRIKEPVSAAAWIGADRLWTYSAQTRTISVRSGDLLNTIDHQKSLDVGDTFPTREITGSYPTRAIRTTAVQDGMVTAMDAWGARLVVDDDLTTVKVLPRILDDSGGAAAMSDDGRFAVAVNDATSDDDVMVSPTEGHATRVRIFDLNRSETIRDAVVPATIYTAGFVGDLIDLVGRDSITQIGITSDQQSIILLPSRLTVRPILDQRNHLMLAGGAGDPITITDSRTGTTLAELPGSMGPQDESSYGVSSSGTVVVTTMTAGYATQEDGLEVSAHSFGYEGIVAQACDLAGRSLSDDEWNSVVPGQSPAACG